MLHDHPHARYPLGSAERAVGRMGAAGVAGIPCHTPSVGSIVWGRRRRGHWNFSWNECFSHCASLVPRPHDHFVRACDLCPSSKTASAESLVLRVPERHSAEYLLVTSALVRITCTCLWAARRTCESHVAAANRMSSQEHIRNFFESERLRVRFLTGHRLEASYSASC